MIKGQPLFWTEKGFISNILLPLSAIYLLLSLLQQFFTTKKKISVPVICVGNIYIGGTGKTPTVQKISSISQSLNKKTTILLRGYGGKINKISIMICFYTFTIIIYTIFIYNTTSI